MPVGAVAGFRAGAAVLAGAAHLPLEPTGRPAAVRHGQAGLRHAVLSAGLLAAAGEAPFTARTALAAVLVAAGGWVASRG